MNSDAVIYVKQYKNQYSLQSLKQALQQQGYTSAEIEDAVREAINPPKVIPFAPKPGMASRAPPPIVPSTPPAPAKKSNTWIIVVVVLLLLLPLLLVGCLIAIPMMFFAGSAASMYHYLPFLASLGQNAAYTQNPLSTVTSSKNPPDAAAPTTNPFSDPVLYQALDFHTLMDALPKQPVDGYIPGKPEGGSAAFPTQNGASTAYSTASNQYTQADQAIKVSVLDTAGVEGLSHMYVLGSIEYERSDGYRRKTMVQGYPAWESYEANNKKTSLIVIVNNRVYVSIDSSQGNVPIEVLRDAANQVNYGLLAGS